MTKISKEQLVEFIININHNSDKMFKIMHEGFVRNDEQHNSLLEELKDLKKEQILLRKDSNKIILIAFIILGSVLGVNKILSLLM